MLVLATIRYFWSKITYLDAHFNVRFIPQRQFCLPKIQEMRSVVTFSLHSASISRVLEPSTQGLISSIIYSYGLHARYCEGIPERFCQILCAKSGKYSKNIVVMGCRRATVKGYHFGKIIWKYSMLLWAARALQWRDTKRGKYSENILCPSLFA